MTRAAGCYFEPGKRCNKNSGDLMQHILLKSDYDLREPPLLHGNFWLQVVSRKVKNKFLNHLMIADTHQTPTEVFFLFLKPITGLCSLSFTWFNGLTGEQEMRWDEDYPASRLTCTSGTAREEKVILSLFLACCQLRAPALAQVCEPARWLGQEKQRKLLF